MDESRSTTSVQSTRDGEVRESLSGPSHTYPNIHSRYRRKLWRFLGALALLLILGVCPTVAAVVILVRLSIGDLPSTTTTVSALGLTLFLGSLGTMVIRLIFEGLHRWSWSAESFTIYRWGLWPQSFRTDEITGFQIELMRGSHEHQIAPFSVLSVFVRGRRVYQFSSRVFENNSELIERLERLGISKTSENSLGPHLRIWVAHVIAMTLGVLGVALERWLT